MRIICVVVLAALTTSLSCAAWAQVTPFIIDQARPDRAVTKPARAATPLAPLPAVAGPPKIAPFVLNRVQIEGSSLPPAILGAAAQPFVGRTVDTKVLGEIAAAVARAYADRGNIALYTIAVPQQDFAGGTLRLSAIEGYIEHVDLSGDVSGRLELVTKYSNRLLQEHPLKRTTFQRYISLIRDIPGLSVDPKLLSGSAPGAVRLLLVLSPKTWHVALSADDLGSNPLGRVQAQARASLYGLLREGEETSVTVSVPTQVRLFQYVALSESQPLDDDGTALQGTFGYLRTRPKSPSPSGTAKNLQFLITHPVLRSYDENFYLSGSVDGIDSSNATLGEIVANERIRALRLSGVYSLTSEKSALGLSASLNSGLDVFGARTTDPALGDVGFKKLVAQASYNRLLGEEWVARLRASAQLAFDRLPVSELYALGGDFGRAFPTAAAFGDSAIAGSAEIGFRPSWLPTLLKGSEIFGFADDGGTWYRSRSGFAPLDFHLASAGAGVGLPFHQETKLELEAAHALIGDAPEMSAGGWRFIFALTTAY
ncbi:MAG TPA: ShlB/FhaC/HecB family hemolysin secretion/activation protein [Rhizomicrobium sp.]